MALVAHNLEIFYQQYHQNTHNPGTDMMVVCLSGSFIISDTFVWWMLPDDAGSNICLMAACRNKFYSCNNTYQYRRISKIMAPLACVTNVIEPGW